MNDHELCDGEIEELTARVAELEAELAGVRACLVEHGQRLAAVIALDDKPRDHWRGLDFVEGWNAALEAARAAATGDQT